MKILSKYWKVLLAVALLVAAFVVYTKYQEELTKHEAEIKQLQTYNLTLQTKIKKNKKYDGVQDKLEEATAQIVASRLELYEKFPVEMKEEDQIMYILYLEKQFGTEINFSFSKAQYLVVHASVLSPGQRLCSACHHSLSCPPKLFPWKAFF